MSTGLLIGLVVFVGFFGSMVMMQLSIARRARAMQGKDVPALPGRVGAQITGHPDALVYFFSPQCGACRSITPRVKKMSEKNPSVFAVDVAVDMDLARALGVMATPSTVEIRERKIVGYHVGPIPGAVMDRFA